MVDQDQAEEVTLIHKETAEVKLDTEAEIQQPAAPTKVGDYTVLDLDDDQDENLIPEAMEGVSFTNEQVDAVDPASTTEEPSQPLPAAPVANAQPVPAPRPQPRPAPMAEPNAGSSALAERNAKRQASIEEYTKRLRTPSGLTDLENEPAYKRRNIQLAPTPASDESQATRLSIDEETGSLKTDNPYLHDNVD